VGECRVFGGRERYTGRGREWSFGKARGRCAFFHCLHEVSAAWRTASDVRCVLQLCIKRSKSGAERRDRHHRHQRYQVFFPLACLLAATRRAEAIAPSSLLTATDRDGGWCVHLRPRCLLRTQESHRKVKFPCESPCYIIATQHASCTLDHSLQLHVACNKNRELYISNTFANCWTQYFTHHAMQTCLHRDAQRQQPLSKPIRSQLHHYEFSLVFLPASPKSQLVMTKELSSKNVELKY
jgi:hypothetical protein